MSSTSKKYPSFKGDVQLKVGDEYEKIGKSALWTYKDEDGRINFITGALTFQADKVKIDAKGNIVVRFNARR